MEVQTTMDMVIRVILTLTTGTLDPVMQVTDYEDYGTLEQLYFLSTLNPNLTLNPKP